LIRSMENMCSVLMYMDFLYIFAVDIPSDVISSVDHKAVFSFSSKFICHDCPVQSCAYDQIVIFFHLSPLLYCAVISQRLILYVSISITSFPLSFPPAQLFSLICLLFLFFHLQISDYALNW